MRFSVKRIFLDVAIHHSSGRLVNDPFLKGVIPQPFAYMSTVVALGHFCEVFDYFFNYVHVNVGLQSQIILKHSK